MATANLNPELAVFTWVTPLAGVITIPLDELTPGTNVQTGKNIPERWKTRQAGKRAIRIKVTNKGGTITLTIPKEHPVNSTLTAVMLQDDITENQVGVIKYTEQGGSTVTGFNAFLQTDPEHEANNDDAVDNVWIWYSERIDKVHGGQEEV